MENLTFRDQLLSLKTKSELTIDKYILANGGTYVWNTEADWAKPFKRNIFITSIDNRDYFLLTLSKRFEDWSLKAKCISEDGVICEVDQKVIDEYTICKIADFITNRKN